MKNDRSKTMKNNIMTNACANVLCEIKGRGGLGLGPPCDLIMIERGRNAAKLFNSAETILALRVMVSLHVNPHPLWALESSGGAERAAELMGMRWKGARLSRSILLLP